MLERYEKTDIFINLNVVLWPDAIQLLCERCRF